MSRRSRPPSLEKLALASLLAVLLAAALAANLTDVDELADEVLAGADYQTEFPGSEVDPLRVPMAGAFVDFLMWVLTAAVIVVMVVWVFNELIGRREVGWTGEVAIEKDAGPERRGPSLALAEQLAADGRFDEAIHAMLLISIEHLGPELPTAPSASKTSRELLRILPLSRRQRDAFGELVRAVELSLFGGRQVGADDYARCRSSLGTLLPESPA